MFDKKAGGSAEKVARKKAQKKAQKFLIHLLVQKIKNSLSCKTTSCYKNFVGFARSRSSNCIHEFAQQILCPVCLNKTYVGFYIKYVSHYMSVAICQSLYVSGSVMFPVQAALVYWLELSLAPTRGHGFNPSSVQMMNTLVYT